jgi:tetratricopeptide (TPR) repeat protein
MIQRLLSRRSVLALGLVIGCFALISARTDGQTTSEAKAFKEARDAKDPQKRLEAFEAFIKNYPYSDRAYSAQEMILDTIIKNWPDRKERIAAQAETLIQSAPYWNKTAVYDDVANKLIAAHILPTLAEELAAKGLAAEEKEIEENARKSKASYLGTLGRAYLNNGKTEQAEKTLKRAYDLDPASAVVGYGLAEMAEKHGDFNQALHYEVAAFLSNRSSEDPRPRTKLEEYYRKVHGSLDGLDAMLDAEYEKASPSPLTVDAYHPGKGRTARVVLAELFTGAGCPPCTSADLSYDGLSERYSRKELAVLVYHLHIPRPDPMTNPSTQARAEFYSTGGTPTYVIDGVGNSGGGGWDYAKPFYNRLVSIIEPELEKPAEAGIALSARLEGNHVVVTADVDNIKSDSKDLKLQIALVEDKLRYSGENGIRFHNMVVRSLGGDKEAGFGLKAGNASIKQDFDLSAVSSELKKSLDDYEVAGHRGEQFTFSEKKYQIDPSDLSVVAFVQDSTSKHVLQAVYVKVNPTGGPEGR